MFVSLIIISAFLAIIAIRYLVQSTIKSCKAPRYLRNVQQCRLLLQKSELKERAQPNQRLVQAFGVDNSFTTTDSKWNKFFVNKAKLLLRTQDEDWKALAAATSDALHQSLSTETPETLLVVLVQTLVFQIVMTKFFSAIQLPSKEDIGFITSRINILWIESKGCSSHVASTKLELERRLQQVFNMDEIQGRSNPLNILLPAYETLWRIVLRTFLEVRFRSSDDDRHKYRTLFGSFLEDPKARFEEYNNRFVSVKGIVKEGLRLYPPTRRIYRQLPNELVAIDVEHLHQDVHTWGVDALRFIPSRSGLRNDKIAYMPFGFGAFECPAKALAGPMLIGILVGALLSELDNKFDLIGDEAENVLAVGPLENGRNAYAGLRIGLKGL